MVQQLQQNQMNAYGYLPQNLLVNPGFEIWQRGTSAFTSDDIFTSDEWKIKRNASDTLQIDDESSIVKQGSLSLKATKTGTNDVAYVRQGIENYQSLEGLTITFSAWVYANAASGARLVVQDYVSSEETVYSDYHAGDSQWAHLTVTKTIRTGLASYASFPHSFGLAVGLELADKAVTAYIDSASLVIGNYPQGVPYIPVNLTDDRMRCYRFYYQSAPEGWPGTSSTRSIVLRGYLHPSYPMTVPHNYPTDMLAVPTITIAYTALAGTATAIVAANSRTKFVQMELRCTSEGFGRGYIHFNAEIT